MFLMIGRAKNDSVGHQRVVNPTKKCPQRRTWVIFWAKIQECALKMNKIVSGKLETCHNKLNEIQR
jgi:hypothetical protein